MEVRNLNQGYDNVNQTKLLLFQTGEKSEARHPDGGKGSLEKGLET